MPFSNKINIPILNESPNIQFHFELQQFIFFMTKTGITYSFFEALKSMLVLRRTHLSRTFTVRSLSAFHLPDSRKSQEAPVNALGEKILFKGSQTWPIRLMLIAGSVNAFYWTGALYTSTLFSSAFDVSQFASFSNNSPVWGMFGYVATTGIFVATYAYSHRVVHTAYESKDGQRLGFQRHNILGQAGYKVEALPSNVKFGHEVYRTTLMPVQVKGIDSFVLLDRDGVYYDNGRIFNMIQKSSVPLSSSGMVAGPSAGVVDKHTGNVVDSKEQRKQKIHETFDKGK
jgi:hypothetical protein